jgi:isochorismate synthase
VQADLLSDSDLVRDAQRRAERLGRPVLVSVTRPIGAFDALLEFERDQSDERLIWQAPGGESMLGLGAAHVIDVHGSDRFADARRAWSVLLADAAIDDPARVQWTGPLALGGFNFDPLRPRTALWSGFPDGRLVVPERLYVQRDGRAWLTTNCVVGATAPRLAAEHRPVAAEPDLDAHEWRALVESVTRGIRDGHLGIDKVVLARSTTVQVEAAFDTAAVLRRLVNAYPTCTIFGVVHGQSSFVGATPERLVALHDGVAVTAALAGSTRRGATPEHDHALGEALLRDPKERAEHAYVVSALRAGLSEVSSRLVADAEPRLRRLANVQHLWTPIRANVASATSILDLLQRLHPTPAMGGFPTQPALHLIRERERLDRGWYASPIGWVNRDGEGEFVVGIRSALLCDRTATLFAGCGIVADSEPGAEFAELGWKLRPMLAALGIPER